MDALWQAEIAITLFLQSLGEWLALPMRLFTSLGQEEFFLVFMPMLYWCIDAGLGLRIGIMLMLTNGVNAFFKLMVHGTRPYWYDARVLGMVSESSFGFPSGHAQHAASSWGLLAALLKRTWLTVILLFIIFAIGISRIYLGAHFISDVLAGWLIGGLLVAAFMALEQPVTRWVRTLRPAYLIGFLFIVSMVLILLVLLPIQRLGDWQMPAVWLENASAAFPDVKVDPTNLDGAFTIAGTFFGMTAGAAWLLHNRGGFDTAGPLGQRALRYALGVVGVLVLWYGLGQLFPRTADMMSYSLRYLRYALVGAWVSMLAPLLFCRLGLARPHAIQKESELVRNSVH